jgi:hypothetical protein
MSVPMVVLSSIISFRTRIRLGTKHRMYAYVRTYGYEDTMQVRLVVENKNLMSSSRTHQVYRSYGALCRLHTVPNPN